MGYTDVGQVLSLQGGSPQTKAGITFIENLKSVQALDGGGLGSITGMLQSILGGSSSLSAMMQNPTAAVMSSLQGMVSGFISSPSLSGFTSTLSALNGLQSTLTSFAATTGALSGITPVDGQYSLLDLLMHGMNVPVLGTPTPTAYSLATAAAPLTSAPLLSATSQAVSTAVAAAQTAGDAATAAAITPLTDALNTVLTNASGAISGLRNMLPVLASVTAVSGIIGAASHPDSPVPGASDLDALLQQIVQPAAYTQLKTDARAQFYVQPPALPGDLAPLINQAATLLASIIAQQVPPAPAATGTTYDAR